MLSISLFWLLFLTKFFGLGLDQFQILEIIDTHGMPHLFQRLRRDFASRLAAGMSFSNSLRRARMGASSACIT
mgnify:CR=1 FL=1